ncbi:histidine kinase [Cohnella kolymensis]|uniref:histidine kinase n=1 Tax=Cohnella kolymensis TaxID=1590652 RepID=A0ABR4ZZF4_9BACL|nr:HAMP domain-containing sensor histidine kinase [Cohnella kolymensis]KIL34200.1 histidine kinase [Cohnella kolymensis]
MRLSNKIHLYSSVLFAALLIVLNLFVYILFYRVSLNSQIERIEAEASTIAEGMGKSVHQIPAEDLLRAYVPLEGMLRVVTPTGTGLSPVTSSSESSLTEREVRFFADKNVEVIKHLNHRYVLVSLPVIWLDGEVVNIQVTQSLRETEENLRVLRNVLIAVTGMALIPVIISSRVLSRLITQPITSMTNTMREIRQSGRFKRLELSRSSNDELVEMGRTFNDMIDLLETNFDKQEQFVSNASHELKTPLTVIESYASLLKRKGLERPELFAESIDAIHSEAIRMREMTEQLLLLARNKSQRNVKFTSVDLAALAQDSAKAFYNAYRRDVHVEAEHSAQGYTDEHLLKQLLFIFLDNARKYSEEPITVHVGAEDGSGWIRIIDRGIGIPNEDLPKVFDRFYRVDEARSRQRGGSGLGLSLAKEIAEAIGARIELDSLENVGTTAVIILRKPPA